MALSIRLTHDPVADILGCARCDTALLATDALTAGAEGALHCPLCGLTQRVQVVEVGGDFALNPDVQHQDALESPVYIADSLTQDEDLMLIDVPGLMEDPAFYGLQSGVAPITEFGWVGGEGLLGEAGYNLYLVVRVADMPDEDLFRIKFPPILLPEVGRLTDELTVVLVSQRKGVFFPEAADVYLEAVRQAGGQPGELVSFSHFVKLEV